MSIVDGPMRRIELNKAATFLMAQEFAGKMESEAKQGAPWTDRVTHARQGIHGGAEHDRDEINIYLAHGVEYGEHLEEGTNPHEIRPKRKKALSWPGASHPVKKVNHPGSKAYPIIGPTVDRNYPEIKDALKEIWS